MEGLIKSQGGSLLSNRGSVAVDERTNTLLLQDTADRLADIRRLVATLDIPVRQVLIEARIVVVNDDFKRDLGARVGYTTAQANGNGIWTTSGTAAGDRYRDRLGAGQPGCQRHVLPRAGSDRHRRARPSVTT